MSWEQYFLHFWIFQNLYKWGNIYIISSQKVWVTFRKSDPYILYFLSLDATFEPQRCIRTTPGGNHSLKVTQVIPPTQTNGHFRFHAKFNMIRAMIRLMKWVCAAVCLTVCCPADVYWGSQIHYLTCPWTGPSLHLLRCHSMGMKFEIESKP